jgi:hypothetical protein
LEENGVKTIHLIGGEKGGVGKTFVSRCLITYFILQGWEFETIEADSSTADVASIHEATQIRLSDHPHRYAEPDVIFNKALQTNVIVNLPSNTQGVLNRWIRQGNLPSLAKEHDITLLHWFVSDGCHASIELLQESLLDLSGKIQHILIRNRGRLNGVDFSYLDQDPLYQSILCEPNLLKVLDFPVLGSAEQYFIDRSELSLYEAQTVIKGELGILASQRIKTFIDELIEVFAQVDFENSVPSPLSTELSKA